jgi:subtilisin family serine protease
LAPGFHEELSRAGTHIKGGDWEQRIADQPLIYDGKYEESFNKQFLVPFDNFVLYESIVEWADHGVPWEETEFYQWATRNRERDSWRFESPEAVRERFAYLTDLYKKIQSQGYKMQAELGDSPGGYPAEYDEILVNIGRNGQFYLDDGRHRICFAKVQNIDTIPIRIFVRHKKWQQIRKEVATKGKHILHDLSGIDSSHPDLQDVIEE